LKRGLIDGKKKKKGFPRRWKKKRDKDPVVQRKAVQCPPGGERRSKIKIKGPQQKVPPNGSRKKSAIRKKGCNALIGEGGGEEKKKSGGTGGGEKPCFVTRGGEKFHFSEI